MQAQAQVYAGNQLNQTQAKSIPQPPPATTVVEALQAELNGLLAMAIHVRSELHEQANRLFGPESETAEPTSPPATGAPQFVQVEDLLRRLKNTLVDAHAGVRRLRRIG